MLYCVVICSRWLHVRLHAGKKLYERTRVQWWRPQRRFSFSCLYFWHFCTMFLLLLLMFVHFYSTLFVLAISLSLPLDHTWLNGIFHSHRRISSSTVCCHRLRWIFHWLFDIIIIFSYNTLLNVYNFASHCRCFCSSLHSPLFFSPFSFIRLDFAIGNC